jgi:hypothetical protein
MSDFKVVLAASLLLSSALFSSDEIKDKIQLIGSNVHMPLQVVPYPQSAASDTILLKVVLPENGTIEKKNSIGVQLKLINFALGVTTRNNLFPQLRECPSGQTVRVVVDNEPFVLVGLQSEDSFNANLDVMRKNLNFKLSDLDKGEHVIRVFPATSYGESIKRYNNFDASTVYVGAKRNTIQQDLSKPYLTYNEPQGEYKLKSTQDPILLDFFISNCTLTREGYKVLLTIDGEVMGKLYQWVPYLIFGLTKGKHTVRLELLDPQDAVVPGLFNVNERTINVK